MLKVFSRLLTAGIFIPLVGCGGQQADSSITNPVTVQITPCTSTSGQTSSPFDLAISGPGLFRMDNSGAITYIQSGTFQLEVSNTVVCAPTLPAFSGNIITTVGNRLTGYNIDANGVRSTTLEDVNIYGATPGAMAPSVTTAVTVQANLNAADAIPAVPFDDTDTTTYNNATSINVYDTLGNAHVFQIFYVKIGTNTWSIYSTLDASAAVYVGQLTFDSHGVLSSAVPAMPVSLSFGVTTGATTPLVFTFSPGNSTQMASAFTVTNANQDGYTSGNVSSFTINVDGTITGHYSNGQSRLVAQIAIID